MDDPEEKDPKFPLDYARPMPRRSVEDHDPTLFLKSMLAGLFALIGIPLGSLMIWFSLPEASYAVRSGYPPFRPDEISDAARLFCCGGILIVSGTILLVATIRAWRRSA
jgi:hypothetical protein